MDLLYSVIGWFLFGFIVITIIQKKDSFSLKKAFAFAKSDKHPKGKHPETKKHDSHTSADHAHDHHPKPPAWSNLLGWVLLVAAFIAFLQFLLFPFAASLGFGQIPGASAERRYVIAERTGTLPDAQKRTSTSVQSSAEWQTLSVPTSKDGWSEWVSIPSGHYILACESQNKDSCSYSDSFSDEHLRVQCRDSYDSRVRDIEFCGNFNAHRFQTTRDKEATVVYKVLRAQ